jgi:hypothetical protein
MPEQFATVTMERRGKKGRPRDILRDEVEMELNVVEVKSW